jgi:hypothetical protein
VASSKGDACEISGDFARGYRKNEISGVDFGKGGSKKSKKTQKIRKKGVKKRVPKIPNTTWGVQKVSKKSLRKGPLCQKYTEKYIS